MTSSASSNGPVSAAIFTARRVLLRLLMDQRDLQWGDLYRTVLGFVRAAERRRRVARYTTRRSVKVAVHGRLPPAHKSLCAPLAESSPDEGRARAVAASQFRDRG